MIDESKIIGRFRYKNIPMYSVLKHKKIKITFYKLVAYPINDGFYYLLEG